MSKEFIIVWKPDFCEDQMYQEQRGSLWSLWSSEVVTGQSSFGGLNQSHCNSMEQGLPLSHFFRVVMHFLSQMFCFNTGHQEIKLLCPNETWTPKPSGFLPESWYWLLIFHRSHICFYFLPSVQVLLYLCQVLFLLGIRHLFCPVVL